MKTKSLIAAAFIGLLVTQISNAQIGKIIKQGRQAGGDLSDYAKGRYPKVKDSTSGVGGPSGYLTRTRSLPLTKIRIKNATSWPTGYYLNGHWFDIKPGRTIEHTGRSFRIKLIHNAGIRGPGAWKTYRLEPYNRYELRDSGGLKKDLYRK